MKKIRILIPVYNDWQSVFKLLENINLEVLPLNCEFSVTIVNDASIESRPEHDSRALTALRPAFMRFKTVQMPHAWNLP